MSYHIDSIHQHIPFLIDRSNTFLKEGLLRGYNLKIGLGSPAAGIAADPVNTLISLFGKDAIPYMMAVFYAAKVFLCGVFIYKWGGHLRFHPTSRLFIALGYAFCGPMMLRSSFMSYSNEYLFVAAALLSAELFLLEDNFICFPLAAALLFCSTDVIRILLYCLFFLLYAAYRSRQNVPETGKKPLRQVLRLFWVLLLAICLSLWLIGPELLSWVAAPRISASIVRGVAQYQLFKPNVILNSILAFISNDSLIGTTGPYKSYLTGPSFFIGIANLLIAPQVFAGAARREKTVYGLCFAAVCAYIVFTPLRVLSHGLAYDSFKLSSFWITLLLCYFAGIGWTRFFKDNILSVPLLLVFCGLLMAGVWIIPACIGIVFPLTSAAVTTLILCVSTVTMTCIHQYKKKTLLAPRLLPIILAGILAADMAFNAIIPQLHVSLVPKTDYAYLAGQGGIGRTSEALKTDEDDYFRVSNRDVENNNHAQLDALANNYFSTAAYLGGRGLPAAYNEFCALISGAGRVTRGNYNYMANEFASMQPINALLGVRYTVYQKDFSPTPPYAGYGQTLMSTDKLWVVENSLALPMAFFYDSVIPYQSAIALSKAERRYLLLQSAVVDSASPILTQSGLRNAAILEWNMQGALKAAALPVTAASPLQDTGVGADIILKEPASADKPYLICYANIEAADFIESASDTKRITVSWAGGDGVFSDVNTANIIMRVGSDQLMCEIPSAGVRFIRIAGENCEKISPISVSAVDAAFFKDFEDTVAARKKQVFEIAVLENSRIEGHAVLDKPQLLCLSFMYDAGWSATVNGKAAQVHKINGGLMGIMLLPGENAVRLTYRVPGRGYFIAASCFGLCLWICLTVLYVVKKKRRRV